jgi:hypothetical protein
MDRKPDANRDPITKAPGSHPVGTGVGAAAGGAAAGAAAGAVAGPAGALAGAAVGAVAGGLAGKGVAEKLDPTVEDAYWMKNYSNEPYYKSGYTFDDYAPAYRTGYSSVGMVSDGRTFDDIDADLEADYNRRRGKSRLAWPEARAAARAAHDRFMEHY